MSNTSIGEVFNTTGGNGSGDALKLETLAITKQPSKTIYKSGGSFDPASMVVMAGYGYGLTPDMTDYTVSPQVLADGVMEMTITYTEGRITKTTNIPMAVEKVLVSITITANPTKMTYQYLETFDPTGMVIIAAYSDESSEEVSGYTHSPDTFSVLGQQAMQIQYAYESVTKTANLTVTVNPIEVTIPVQNGVLAYDGETKTPTRTGYDTGEMIIFGKTNGVNADTYSAKFVLDYGYVFPGGQNEAAVNWVINRAVIASPPKQSNALAANGEPQSPTWDNYSTSKLTIDGGRFGIEAKDYTVTLTPTPSYK